MGSERNRTARRKLPKRRQKRRGPARSASWIMEVLMAVVGCSTAAVLCENESSLKSERKSTILIEFKNNNEMRCRIHLVIDVT